MAAGTNTNMLEQTREKFSKRLAELAPMVEEAQELERVLNAMGGTKKGNGRKRGTSATAKTRAGRGARPAEFKALVDARPGITVAEAAKEMDVNANYLYALAKRLTEAGDVRKVDSGYHPVPAEAKASPETPEDEPVAV